MYSKKKFLLILRNIFIYLDKKDFVKKEIKAVTEKLTVLNRFEEKVKKIEEFVNALNNFDKTLKDIGTTHVYNFLKNISK